MIANPTDAPTAIDHHRQCEADHWARPRGSCLGAGCCDWCGRGLGQRLQKDGTWHDYHATGYCED